MKKMLNVTDITGYLFCNRKVYLKIVENLTENLNKKMALGILKHKIFDSFNKNEAEVILKIKPEMAKDEIEKIYNASLEKEISSVFSQNSKLVESFGIVLDEVKKETEKTASSLIKIKSKSVIENMKNGFIGKELFLKLQKYFTEIEVFSEKLGLKGRIDKLEVGEEIIPHEIKNREEIFESDKIQLAAYALLLEERFNKKVKKAIIETKSNETEIEITNELKNKVLEIADEIRNMKEIPPLPSNFSKCNFCGLKDFCYN